MATVATGSIVGGHDLDPTDPFPGGANPVSPGTTAVIVPVKSFDLAKERLAATLGPEERSRLARSMAAGVVAAAKPLPAFVVCGSPEVAAWAVEVGAGVIWYEPPGLNRSITHAVGMLAGEGYRRAIIAHGDLPLATTLAWVADFDGVTIVPDRRGDGTNVMALPLGTDFRFRYGPGSAEAHRVEADRVGLAVRSVVDEALGWDVDTPGDLSDLPVEAPLHGDGNDR